MSNSLKVIALGCVVGLTALISVNCTPTHKAKTEPEVDSAAEPPAALAITMKPYHYAMSEEMHLSFDKADEIIVAVYTGKHMDKQNGLTYYFDNFTRFNKETKTWGPVENTLLPILSRDIKPEIITRKEFKHLSDVDRVGICWDNLDEIRYVYFVEGEPSLLFLKRVIDEENYTSYLSLLDTYPVTKDCNAKAVFDLTVK